MENPLLLVHIDHCGWANHILKAHIYAVITISGSIKRRYVDREASTIYDKERYQILQLLTYVELGAKTCED